MWEAGALGVGYSLHEGMGLARVEIFPVCLAPSAPGAYGHVCTSGRMLLPLILPNPGTSPPHCDTVPWTPWNPRVLLPRVLLALDYGQVGLGFGLWSCL